MWMRRQWRIRRGKLERGGSNTALVISVGRPTILAISRLSHSQTQIKSRRHESLNYGLVLDSLLNIKSKRIELKLYNSLSGALSLLVIVSSMKTATLVTLLRMLWYCVHVPRGNIQYNICDQTNIQWWIQHTLSTSCKHTCQSPTV